MRVIVIGAGINGASVAWRLAGAGAEVTVLETAGIAQAASGASFGWLNASFFANEAHFRLRRAGLDAWHRVAVGLKQAAPDWCGALWWEETGAAFDAARDRLAELGYPVEELDAREFARREPLVANPPEQALAFGAEGVADLPEVARAMLGAPGIRLVTGCHVTALRAGDAGVTGIETDLGGFEAEQVVVAAGIAAPALVAPLGVALPMLHRPGLMLRSRPLAPVIRHVLAAPGQELRQDAAGRLLAPTAAAHPADTSRALPERPDLLADTALDRVAALLPGARPDWAEVTHARRPVPGDGLPVIGPAGPAGLWLSVMHSGATLAALAGELLAAEIMGAPPDPLLESFRPARFG